MSGGNKSAGAGRTWLIGLLLVCGTLACYWPVRHFDFIGTDDPEYVAENATVRKGLTEAGLAWALQSMEANNWHPVTWLSHMLDCQCFGPNPGAHHVVNLVFHTTNALLLFLMLRWLAQVRQPERQMRFFAGSLS